MKKTIRINFVDFWEGFIKEDNYFIHLLSRIYSVELSDEPDFIIYSCYGREYLKYKCVRIFYTAENQRPDFSGCDYALSFDLGSDDPRQYRLPLYALYIGLWGQEKNVLQQHSRETMKEEWKMKSGFCCMLVSNGSSKRRIDFFHALSARKHVDSGGRYLNNIGGPVGNKLDFIKNYKFVFAFENTSYPGYVTEKLIEPCFTHSIPIYWGNPRVDLDFNPKRFINCHDFPNDEAVIEKILEIDRNDEMALDMISQPIFNDNRYPGYIQEENVLSFLRSIVEREPAIKPVALTGKRLVHEIHWRSKVFGEKLKYRFNLRAL